MQQKAPRAMIATAPKAKGIPTPRPTLLTFFLGADESLSSSGTRMIVGPELVLLVPSYADVMKTVRLVGLPSLSQFLSIVICANPIELDTFVAEIRGKSSGLST